MNRLIVSKLFVLGVYWRKFTFIYTLQKLKDVQANISYKVYRNRVSDKFLLKNKLTRKENDPKTLFYHMTENDGREDT